MKALRVALTQIGIKEIVGKQDNPEVLKYFNETGFDGAKLKDETAWCAAFINWCCKEAGLPYSNKLTARSWLKIGNQTSQPKLGDIAVFWRGSPDSWQGHVGFYIRENVGWIYVLGGNQSNQVSIKAYPKSRVLQYRELC
ncbi:TIGR02594 family protein [Aquimarina sp. W85]|uniref:TIGR02594 family protein n=1 Tax=Aquimarina rhodophyticola TaxID=3342246 RepID=UPI003671907F